MAAALQQTLPSLVLFFLVQQFLLTEASYFRGGTISWKPDPDSTQKVRAERNSYKPTLAWTLFFIAQGANPPSRVPLHLNLQTESAPVENPFPRSVVCRCSVDQWSWAGWENSQCVHRDAVFPTKSQFHRRTVIKDYCACHAFDEF